MSKKKDLGLSNMNGMTKEDDKTCGLSDMNCLGEKDDKDCALDDMVAAIRRMARMASSLPGMT